MNKGIKKSILIFLGLILSISLIGCDNKKDCNVTVKTHYKINTSETVKVNSYNGYKLIKSNVNNDKDGSIVVTLKFDKIIYK